MTGVESEHGMAKQTSTDALVFSLLLLVSWLAMIERLNTFGQEFIKIFEVVLEGTGVSLYAFVVIIFIILGAASFIYWKNKISDVNLNLHREYP